MGIQIEMKLYKIAKIVRLTWQEIRDKEDPDGKNHDLELTCVSCGNSQTCRCSKPKRHFFGICPECENKPENNPRKREPHHSLDIHDEGDDGW